jgi:Mechanosensitive ion channel
VGTQPAVHRPCRHNQQQRNLPKTVYNYTRQFPYIWDEVKIPITYEADRARAESILLDAVNRHALNRQKLGDRPVEQLRRNYQVDPIDLDPTVYYRLTDNWLELTVRFLAADHGTRRIRDHISRDVITALDEANIQIASGTYAIVQLPPIEIGRLPQLTVATHNNSEDDTKSESSKAHEVRNQSDRERAAAGVRRGSCLLALQIAHCLMREHNAPRRMHAIFPCRTHIQPVTRHSSEL